MEKLSRGSQEKQIFSRKESTTLTFFSRVFALFDINELILVVNEVCRNLEYCCKRRKHKVEE